MPALASANDQRYLATLRAHWKQHRCFPSLAKLAPQLGLSSAASVFAVVTRLERAEFLMRRDGRVAPGRRFFAYPMLDAVRPGAAPRGEVELLSVEDLLTPEPHRAVMWRVRDNSMRGAGLLEGDFVIVEAKSIVEPGDIVVAAVNGQRIVRYLRKANGLYFLEAANSSCQPVHPETSLNIVGLVTGSFRTIGNRR